MNRPGSGRPLRFVGGVALAWIGLRAMMLMPAAELPAPLVPPAQSRRVAQPRITPLPPLAYGSPFPRNVVRWRPDAAPLHRSSSPLPPPVGGRLPALLARPADIAAPDPVPAGPRARFVPDAPPPRPVVARRYDRWRASLWLVARPGSGIGAVPGAGQIGGSQYGLRIVRPLGSETPVAAVGRVAGPLAGRGAEAAIGLEWQVARPIRLIVERRIPLDGGAGGSGVGVIFGIDHPLSPRLRIEAYGQAGVILRGRSAPYVDGAGRLIRRLFDGHGIDVSAGAGLWGAAQREARRLDAGPSLVVGVPLGASRARIALDWRQRIAGDGRPGSGLALSIGSDF